MQRSKSEGSSESKHSPLCPIKVIVQTSDVCLPNWGVCAQHIACRPVGLHHSQEPLGPAGMAEERNSLLGFLWLRISSIFLWPCRWLHLIHLDQFKKYFTSLCHLPNVACDLFPFSLSIFFPFLPFCLASFLSVLLAIFTLSSIMVLLYSTVCW